MSLLFRTLDYEGLKAKSCIMRQAGWIQAPIIATVGAANAIRIFPAGEKCFIAHGYGIGQAERTALPADRSMPPSRFALSGAGWKRTDTTGRLDE